MSHGATLIVLACAGNCGRYGAGVHTGEKTDWGEAGEEYGEQWGCRMKGYDGGFGVQV